ncbi:hypothetical protein C3L33_19537, partial [Rhododendron williamsianum]
MADGKPQANIGIPVSGQKNSITPIPDFDPPKKPKRNKYAFACAILASMTSILLGYDIGVMSGAGLSIQEDLKISDTKLEVLMGILNVYSLIGSFAAGRTSDWIGRRYTIVLASVIFFAGAILMGFAPNYAFLMVGRFVAGVGVGYALMIAPVYTAEVSPASSRGFLTSFPEVFINAGILLGYVSNYAFSKLPLHLGWRLMLGVGGIPSVFLALGVLAMPESPRWLVLQGRLGDAKRVLDRTSDSKEEAVLRLADIKEAAGIPEECNDDVVQVPKRSHGEDVWKELLLHPTPTVKHILIAGIGIHFFQQTSGIDAVVLYKGQRHVATLHGGGRSRQDRVHSRGHIFTGSGRAKAVALNQRRRNDRVPRQSRDVSNNHRPIHRETILGPISGHHLGAGLRRDLLYRYGAHHVGLQLRDLPLEAAGPGDEHGSGCEPCDERYHIDDLLGKTLEEMQVLFGTFFGWRTTMRELEKNKRVTGTDGEGDQGNVNGNGQVQMGTPKN